MPMHYIYLVIAILAEVAATTALPASRQFTQLWPSILVVVGYATAFFFLSLTVKVMPVGIVYAIWAGLGIVAVAVLGVVIYGQRLDLAAIAGMGLIIAGVLVINLLSSTTGH
ncbi:QacE family quaternary ammonium compound efflux SMR transporter [Meridianimarinicoccus roseus]|uniref:QacE family quaternary ammonium compound efflux SMR transporter n=2 Tax=Meridianimarinicoccus roseus TaxID=2072018 RepID=A0A2V2LIS6_9RHOB|nr:multidrug efflux SMR transporter [Meridianimarinicoccus roseus]PWR03474.1 QacE family quaternary ammonium compound efflux SMR transporter [Meridianimarinicoccus roseus]